MKNIHQLLALLGDEKEDLLAHVCQTIPKNHLHLPDAMHLDACFLPSNRNNPQKVS